MQEVQEQMGNNEYTGKSGGGLVHILVNGKGDVRKVTINPNLLKESEKEIKDL